MPYLIWIDFIVIFLAFLSAYGLRDLGPFRYFLDGIQPFFVYLKVFPIAAAALIFTLGINRLYDEPKLFDRTAKFYELFKSIALWMLLIMSFSYLSKYDYSRIIVLLTGLFTFLYLALERGAAEYIRRQRAKRNPKRVLIIGDSEKYKARISDLLSEVAPLGYQGAGCVNWSDALSKFDHTIEEVIFYDDAVPVREALNFVYSWPGQKTRFWIPANIFHKALGLFELSDYPGMAMVELSLNRQTWGYLIAKRCIDAAGALFLLGVTMPLWFLLMAIPKNSRNKILFSQTRAGYLGKPFTMWKFKTMREDASDNSPIKLNDSRVTLLGRFLRRWSMDELPQIINVLKGEMSLVGPRPELLSIAANYEPWQKRRFDAKPGITGLWQVLGRKDLPLIDNIQYDLYYVSHPSILLDLVILLKTIPAVIRGKGAY